MKNVILSFLLFFVFQLTWAASPPPIDIVSDIDWTLVSIVSEEMADTPNVFKIENEYYRLSDWGEQFFEALAKEPFVRLSFYSGGSKARNEELLKKIKLPQLNKTLYDIAYKILNYEDLIKISEDKNLSFSDRFKKDLRLINSDLSQVVLIDDNAGFAMPGQEKNMIWLGKTYNYYENFQDIKTVDEYTPPNLSEWFRDRNKLVGAYEKIHERFQLKTPFCDLFY